MSGIGYYILLILGGAFVAAIYQYIVQVFIIYFLGRLKLTNWFGYILGVSWLVSAPIWLWEKWPPLVLFIPLAMAMGAVRAPRALARWKAGEGEPLIGVFFFGTPPEGVRNTLSFK